MTVLYREKLKQALILVQEAASLLKGTGIGEAPLRNVARTLEIHRDFLSKIG